MIDPQERKELEEYLGKCPPEEAEIIEAALEQGEKIIAEIRPSKAPLAIPVEEFLASGPDSIEWLCPDLIPQGGLVILAAWPKAGKSLLTTNLALAVAQGSEFLRRDCKKANSLILQLEDPPVLIRERLRKMGMAEGAYIRSGLLFTEEEWKQLPEFIKQKEIQLVVLDPLVFATGGGDENDAAKMSRFFLKLREIIFSTGTTIIIVHHHRKSRGEAQGDQIRGSSAILGAVDVALELVRENDVTPTATLKVTSRLGIVEDQIVRLDVDTLTWQFAGRAEDWKNAQRENEILQILESDGEMTIPRLEKALDVTHRTFRKPLGNLVTKGLVEVSKQNQGGRGRKCSIYKLAEFSAKPQESLAEIKQRGYAENRIFGENENIGVIKNAENSETPEKPKKLTMDEMIEETKRVFPGSEIVDDVPF